MPDLNDLKLDKWQGSFEPEPARTGLDCAGRGPVAGRCSEAEAITSTGARHLSRRRKFGRQPSRPLHPPAPARPLPEAGETIDLPPLPETDPIVRELVAQLSSHPTVAAWLTTDQLIRNFTVVVENIRPGARQRRSWARCVRPEVSSFARSAAPSRSTRAATSATTRYADAVSGLDARGTARLYATLKPRIEDGYKRARPSRRQLRSRLQQALVELLKTPVLEGDVALASKSVAYEYADPRLQGLSSVQRQFLRMGPRNVRLIQSKLREIAPFLG